MTLVWSEDEPGTWIAQSGATTFVIAAGWRLPDVRKWNVYLSHAEMERGDDGLAILKYQGWGHDLEDAQSLAQLICDAPLGDDSARLEWMRRHQAELATEVRHAT